MKVHCDYCDKELDRKPSWVRKRKHHFCTIECRHNWQRSPEGRRALREQNKHLRSPRNKFTCSYCDKEFTQWASQRRHNHAFCNPDCYHAWRKDQPSSEPNVTISCANCRQLVTRWPSQINADKPTFCSHSCAATFYGKQRKSSLVRVQCDYCGARFLRKPSHAEATELQFCSTTCYHQWQKDYGWPVPLMPSGPNNPNYNKIECQCDFCKTDLARSPSRYHRAEHHFCSQDCHMAWRIENFYGSNHPLWLGGPTPDYGPNWRQQRKRVRARDYFVCQICSRSEKNLGQELDVHHLIPFRYFGLENYENANHLTNLVSLCMSHHKELETLTLGEQLRRLYHKPKNFVYQDMTT